MTNYIKDFIGRDCATIVLAYYSDNDVMPFLRKSNVISNLKYLLRMYHEHLEHLEDSHKYNSKIYDTKFYQFCLGINICECYYGSSEPHCIQCLVYNGMCKCEVPDYEIHNESDEDFP